MMTGYRHTVLFHVVVMAVKQGFDCGPVAMVTTCPGVRISGVNAHPAANQNRVFPQTVVSVQG